MKEQRTESSTSSMCKHDLTLLAQADVFLLLADLLRPPGSAALPSPYDSIELVHAAFPDEMDGNLAEAVRSLVECAHKTPWAAWSDEYHRLFEGPIACPINETTYVRRDKGAILADVCGFYRAFGFEPSPDVGEKPDHLRCQFEFLAALIVMHAQAVEQQLEEQAEIVSSAMVRFAEDHLAEWLASFCARLTKVTALAVYGRLAESLPLVWRVIARQRQWPDLEPSDPERGEHEEIELDPMPCGTGQSSARDSAGLPCDVTIKGRPKN